MSHRNFLGRHVLFLFVILIYIVVALAYTSLVPLGEAPDEPAHLRYAQFIADNDRLPVTLAERQTAGYRSTWPPLYHSLVSLPLSVVGDRPPDRLKAVGDTPRRLIPTNGQTIASFIHTADEAWPWQGITRAWHLARLISVVLMGLTIGIIYAIALRLTGQRLVSAAAAGIVAFSPQVLFVSSVVNDDNLLILLSSLILLLIITLTRSTTPRHRSLFGLGLLLGLATVAKYNALPLWAITLVRLIWLFRRNSEPWVGLSFLQRTLRLVSQLLAVAAGAILTGAWWFSFVWRNFNQVETQGLIRGSLAALSAGTADASLRELTGGSSSIKPPPLPAWSDWFTTFFKSFWGLFGGGSTIELPVWIYWLLAVTSLVAVTFLLFFLKRTTRLVATSLPLVIFVLVTPLFFLLLPLFRFVISGDVIETAQGRHLFPALGAIAVGLVLGLWLAVDRLGRRWLREYSDNKRGNQEVFSLPLMVLLLGLPLFLLVVSLYSLNHIRAQYPPLIPLSTAAATRQTGHRQPVELAEGVSLIEYELAPPADSVLPVTLVWQADAIPPSDYLVELRLSDSAGLPVGGWLGHPLGGRYPTRAWDKNDVLWNTISTPYIVASPGISATLSLRLLDVDQQPAGEALSLGTVHLPAASEALAPSHLRADGLPADDPFSYRSTLSFVLPEQAEPAPLVTPAGESFWPTGFIATPGGTISHYIVAADWPRGEYHLADPNGELAVIVNNRNRQFEAPPASHRLEANFDDNITLIGYDLPQNRVQPGDTFPLTLHLQARRTMGQNFVIFNHLLDNQAIQRGGADRVPLKYYTTYLWVPQEVVSDSYAIEVDPHAPPGVYWLDVGFYPADNPASSLPLVVDGVSLERSSVSLGPIKVGGPPPGTVAAEIEPQHPLRATFDNQITLAGFSLEPANGPNSAADQSTLTLYWLAETIPVADYTVFVHLVGPDGELIAQADSPPAAGAYPTGLWDPGEYVVDEHSLPALSPGRYSIQIGLYHPDTGDRLPVPGSTDRSLILAELEVSP